MSAWHRVHYVNDKGGRYDRASSPPRQFSPTLSPDLRRASRKDKDNDLLSLTEALHGSGPPCDLKRFGV